MRPHFFNAVLLIALIWCVAARAQVIDAPHLAVPPVVTQPDVTPSDMMQPEASYPAASPLVDAGAAVTPNSSTAGLPAGPVTPGLPSNITTPIYGGPPYFWFPPNIFSTHGYCSPVPLYASPVETTYATIAAVGFRRDWQKLQTIATFDTPTNPVMSTHDFDFAAQPGLSLLVGRRLGDYFALEGQFIGLLQWEDSRFAHDVNTNSLGTAGNLFSPFTHFGQPPAVGFDYNTDVVTHSESTFNSAEINLRQRFDTPPSAMQASGIYGFRYMNLQERFEYRTNSVLPVGPGTSNAVDVATRNNLFGVQVGVTVDFRIEPRAWLTFDLKGFMCHNAASENTSFATGPLGAPSLVNNSDQSHGRMVFGGDTAASLVWRFFPSVVGRIGYQCIFLDGLALASDNFLRNAPQIPVGTTQVYRDGHLAFHGPFAGLTLTW